MILMVVGPVSVPQPGVVDSVSASRVPTVRAPRLEEAAPGTVDHRSCSASLIADDILSVQPRPTLWS